MDKFFIPLHSTLDFYTSLGGLNNKHIGRKAYMGHEKVR